MVLGGLACGHVEARRKIFQRLDALPKAPVAERDKAREVIERRQLMGRDKPLAEVASEWGLAYCQTDN